LREVDQVEISSDGSTIVIAQNNGFYCNGCATSPTLVIADLSFSEEVVSTPLLQTPQDQVGTEGDIVSMWVDPLNANAYGQLTFSAVGLPPGLSIDANGLISGTISSGAKAGSPYTVTITATNALSESDSTTFNGDSTIASNGSTRPTAVSSPPPASGPASSGAKNPVQNGTLSSW